MLCRNASRYTGAQFAAAAEELLETSNITALEEQVLSFLFSNAGSLKLLALLDDLMTMLKEVGLAIVGQHVSTSMVPWGETYDNESFSVAGPVADFV